MKHMKRITALLLSILAIITQSGCSNAASGIQEKTSAASTELNPVTKESFYFDTVCQITVYRMSESDETENAEAADGQGSAKSKESSPLEETEWEESAGRIIDGAFALCSEYEKLLSKTVEGSDIWNINHAGGESVSCDERTIELIQKGIQYGELSGGVFDITIGKAEDLWDFHGDNPKVPEESLLEEAVSHVDYTKIRTDEGNGTVQLLDSEAEIDLGGIAKGYIADAVSEYLQGQGVLSAIISLGGNIVCVGEKEENVPFCIGIETPYSDRTEIVGSADCADGTLVTSGVYERYFTVGEKEYHHILNPQTGYPAQTDVLGVTIEGALGTSGDCDALSTICLSMGSEKGSALIEGLEGYEAVFILRDGSIVTTSGADFTAAK